MYAFLLKGWNRGRISYVNDIISLSCCSPSLAHLQLNTLSRLVRPARQTQVTDAREDSIHFVGISNLWQQEVLQDAGGM